MLQEFKEFALKGNLVEIGVGLVLALAFKALIDAFVNGLLMPIVSMLFGEPSFNALKFTINDSVFMYGTVITQIVTFTLVALALFVFVVKPYKLYQARREAGVVVEETAPPEDIQLLREIRDALTK